jgi:hypothetical protein
VLYGSAACQLANVLHFYQSTALILKNLSNLFRIPFPLQSVDLNYLVLPLAMWKLQAAGFP